MVLTLLYLGRVKTIGKLHQPVTTVDCSWANPNMMSANKASGGANGSDDLDQNHADDASMRDQSG
jgi:hypothetical protein